MEWPAVDEAPLSTAPLIVDQGLFTIEAGDVEQRGGKYILQQGEALTLTCNTPELTVQQIRPDAGFEYPRDDQGCVVLDGTVLAERGDRYGALEIGIFHAGLVYPLDVFEFQLPAPFSVRGEVVFDEGELKIDRLIASNKPDADSQHYPYTLEYNFPTRDDDWIQFDLKIEGPDDFQSPIEFHEDLRDINAGYGRWNALTIRLQSSRGELHPFRTISDNREIIRFSGDAPVVAVCDWINSPNVLEVDHEKYEYDHSTRLGTWVEYPKLKFSSALEWLEFEPFCFDIERTSLRLLEDGNHLDLSASLDFSAASGLNDFIEELLRHIKIKINGTEYSLAGAREIRRVDNESRVDIVLRFEFPGNGRRLPKKSIIPTKWAFVDNGLGNVFMTTNWDLRLSTYHQSKPRGPFDGKHILSWRDAFIQQEGDLLSSRVHPNLMRLYKLKLKKSMSIFCARCGTLGYREPGGGLSCSRCGWTNDDQVLEDYDEVETTCISSLRITEQEMYLFDVQEDQLEAGTYVLYFNGMSFQFKVR